MKSVVLDGFAVNPGDLSWDFLGEFGTYTVYDKTNPEDIMERIADADIVLTNRAGITADVILACPKIRYVTALGTGYDMIDVQACRKAGIEVCNVPGYATDTVAQFAFTLLLAMTTDLNGLSQIVKDGKWTGTPGFAYQKIPFTELCGKTVGIYGCGAIGQKFGKLCAAFSMNVLGYRRGKTSGYSDGIQYVTKEELLLRSDYLSLHCPLTEETRNMVNQDFIDRMKPGAYLINTARGAVINESDLADALHDGRLSGAALDVMVTEPPHPDNPLLSSPNCIITPHCAWTAIEARRRLLTILSDNIRAFVTNGHGINRVF